MHALKAILLTGTAVVALAACSADGPGEIGSVDDIVVRNAGQKSAMPPPGAEPVKEVQMSETLERASDEAVAEAQDAVSEEGPSAAEVIAAPDTGVDKAAAAVEQSQDTMAQAAMAQEQAMKDQAAAKVEEAMPAAEAPAVEEEQPVNITWNEHEERMTGDATAPDGAVAPVPSAPPVEDQQAAEEAMHAEPTLIEQAEANQAPAPVAASATPVVDEPAAMQLSRVDGPVPFDPAILQSKDPAKIKALQKALKTDGFYNGPVNGEMTSDTLNAYVKYQTAANKNVTASAPVMAAPAPTPAPAPVPVMDQAAPAPAAPTAPVFPESVDQPIASGEAVPAPVMEKPAASPRPLMVSRQTPEPLPPVGGAYQPAVPAAAGMPPSVPAPAVESVPSTFTAAGVSMSDPAVISAVQKALTAKGLYNGPATGKLDAMLLNALSQYQGANGLTPGGLNLDTLKSLGVVTQ